MLRRPPRSNLTATRFPHTTLFRSERHPQDFGFRVSHTTRAPLPGEVQGVHYHFVERSQFEQDVCEGCFLEHANVHTNMYGTSVSGVKAVQAQGKICVLDIDIQGVKQVKHCTLSPCPKYLFVAPPSMEELERRLRGDRKSVV